MPLDAKFFNNFPGYIVLEIARNICPRRANYVFDAIGATSMYFPRWFWIAQLFNIDVIFFVAKVANITEIGV